MDLNSVKDLKWLRNYDLLLAFRHERNKWPAQERANPDSEESKLGNFAFTQRKKFREDSLEDWQFEKLLELGFNFEGKTDNWFERFSVVKALLYEKGSVSPGIIGDTYYAWLRHNWIRFQEGGLNRRQASAIESLQLQTYFPTWEEDFEKVRQWVQAHKKLPTRSSYSDGHSWLMSQRATFKKNRLSPVQIDLLLKIGFELEPKEFERDAEIWKNRLGEYISYMIAKTEGKISKYPTSVYNWVQDQRAVFKRGKSNRKPLDDWKVEALNAVGFKWSHKEVIEDEWNDQYARLRIFLFDNCLEDLINESGRTSTNYNWLQNQLKKFRVGNYPPNHEARLRLLGFNFKGRGAMSSFDSNWKQMVAASLGYISQADFDDQLSYLTMLGPTDVSIDTFRRVEHHGLQKALFNAGQTFECAFCGSYFPRGLMVAAHIKPRALCQHQERLDLNVVVPACKFGCDELFERGYISVQDGIILARNDLPSTPAVTDYINRLSGRTTPYFQERRRKYFEAHYQHHNLKT
ncbi:Helicase associated domain protein [uncultured Mucilaginibacter sp.]|uniref:Helicase associated domain protein n=1 Tax=uncultured Mucilaginibacter sp. TaxID=797541 RepID=UPI0025DEA089|nr:Helicase associated domain protein [uncultured Mucilaginibacter sp.]